MADSAVPITAGSGTNVDTRTTTTTGDHRQVIVVGDPDTDAAVAEVQNTTPAVGDYGVATRPIGGTAGTPAGSVLSVQGVVGGQFLPVGAFASAVLTKGTQLVNGFMVQRIHDAGRNPVNYFSNVAVAGASAEALLSLTGMKNYAAVTATTTPAVVTAGKVLRIMRFAATFVASATSVYAVFKLRVNTGGAVLVGSPILATIIVGAGTPATANSTNTEEASFPEGLEVPAGAGIGITAQTYTGTTATNGGFVAASVLGFEY
jgi:hypothetical protein